MALKKQIIRSDSWVVLTWNLLNTIGVIVCLWFALNTDDKSYKGDKSLESRIEVCERGVEEMGVKVQVLENKKDTVIVEVKNIIRNK